jgi:predicted nuclease of predicted toxin-antitoxin system
MTPDEIVADFPELTLDSIRGVLAFAADRERRVAGVAPDKKQPGAETLLIVEYLSRRLNRLLAPEFPDCRHVADFDLLQADDTVIHGSASARYLTLVSKDDDFRSLVDRFGPPPKLVLGRLGNVSRAELATALLDACATIRGFLQEPGADILTIGPVGAPSISYGAWTPTHPSP